MLNNIIKFRSARAWLNEKSASVPKPTQNTVPEWYREADRFAKHPYTNEYYAAPQTVCPFPKEGTKDDFGKIPTWKACPAILDGFSTGYVFRTPTELTFFKNEKGIIDVKVKDQRHKDFVSQRPPMPQFQHPKGYYKDHFAWYPDWGLKLPEGYSALYMTPMNRYDLPFLNTSGVVDNDKVFLSGTFPFFIADGWEGVIPEGTPYMQLLPFKREDWSSEIEFLNEKQIYNEMMQNVKKYRVPDGGVYKSQVWSKREYK